MATKLRQMATELDDTHQTHFKNIFLIEGGFKNIVEQNCRLYIGSYIQMNDKNYLDLFEYYKKTSD